MTAGRLAREHAPTIVVGALALAAAVFVAAAPASAADVVPKDPVIAGTFSLASGNDGSDYAVGASIGWNDPVIALAKAGDLTDRLTAPPGTESVVTFVGPQGREADPASWNATAPWPYTEPGQLLADVTPYHLITQGTGTPSGTNATATVSGDYSLGVAYLTDGGQHVAPGGLYFVHIHLTGNPVPDRATYTWQPIEASGPAVTGGATSGGGGTTPAGMLSFTASSSGDPWGTLTVGGAGAAVPTWTATVSDGVATRTLAAGSGTVTRVDPPGAPASPAGRVTLTVVGG